MIECVPFKKNRRGRTVQLKGLPYITDTHQNLKENPNKPTENHQSYGSIKR